MVAVKTYLTIIAVSLLLGLARSAAKDAADLVNEVRAGHTAARRSIQTLSASIRVELIKPISELLAAGKYWRVGDDVRVHQNTIYVSTIDYRVTNGEVRQITLPGLKGNGRSGPPGTAGWTTERDYSTRTNTFAEMLLILIDPDGNAIDLNSLLAAATTRVTSEREQLNGDDCVKLKLSVASRRGLITNYTLWHAKNRNYLITQVETNYDGSSDGRFIAKVTGWCELVPGVLVPIKVDSTIL